MTRPGRDPYTVRVFSVGSDVRRRGWRTRTFRGRFPPPPLLLSLLALALLLVAGPIARAGDEDDDAPTLHALVLSSDLIVVGKIVHTTYLDRENDLADISYNHEKRYTAVIGTIRVDDTLKGEPVTQVRFTFPKLPRVHGEPTYDLGNDGVWLLRKSDKRDEYVADEPGRFLPRGRKEQIRAILIAAHPRSGNGQKGSEKRKRR